MKTEKKESEMSDRPTPETDAAEIAYNQLKDDEVDAAMGMFGVKPKYGTPNGWKVARKLERERDEAREEIAALKDRIKELEGQVSYARHERNKALNEIDGYKSTFDVRWQAQMRAVTRWQEETGKKEFWPGHEDLCLWLMRKLEAAK